MTIKTKQITVYLDDEGGEHATLEAAARKNAERKLYVVLDASASWEEIQASDVVEIIIKRWADLCEIMRDMHTALPDTVDKPDEVDTSSPWTQAQDDFARKKGARKLQRSNQPGEST